MKWLTDLAPTLMNALSGNIPGAVLSATGFIANKLGFTGTADEVKKQLESMSPEQRIELAKLDKEFAQIELQKIQADNLDRASARARNNGKIDLLQYFVSGFVLVIFATMVLFLLNHLIPVENRETLAVIIGVLTGAFKDIVQFLFGSSKGSNDKTKIIESMSANKEK